MEVRLALKAAGFVSLIAVGIPSNLAALLLLCHVFIAQGHMLHNEFILSQLAFANLMVLLCLGIPQALNACGINPLFSGQVCKTICFVYRVGRAMSIAITSLLSTYQCVVMAPSTPGWTWLKRWLPGHLPHTIIFLSGLSFAIARYCILYGEAFPVNGTIPEFTINLEFCIVVFPSAISYMANGAAFIVRDFTFVGLMVTSGVYVMLLLHRHRQQVQGLQGAGRKTLEASRAVLLLVSTYVALFGLDNIMWFYSLSVTRLHAATVDARVFFAMCYSTISPVLIIATNKKLATSFNCASKCKATEIVQRNVESSVSQVTPTK